MNDKKQIEEMAREICNAKIVVENGYQKVDKDSFVISREEYESDLTTQYDVGYEFGSKETAEKFLQLAYDRCLEKSFIKKVEELAKQFGVEIEE